MLSLFHLIKACCVTMAADSHTMEDSLSLKDDQELPDGTADFYQYCIPKLETAVNALDNSLDKFASPKEYEEFFCDFKLNFSPWFVYLTPDEYCHYVDTASRIVSVLNVLCECYYNRGAFSRCAEVLVVSKPVIDRFCAVTEHLQSRSNGIVLAEVNRVDLFAYRKVAHQHHILVTNVAAVLRCTTGIGKYYRYLILHEINTKQSKRQHNFAGMFSKLLTYPLTCAADLARSTNAELDECVRKRRVVEQRMGMYRRKYSVYAECEGCYAVGISNTSAKGLYKLCARCKMARYCCKECQVKDHARHRVLCTAVVMLGK